MEASGWHIPPDIQQAIDALIQVVNAAKPLRDEELWMISNEVENRLLDLLTEEKEEVGEEEA